MRVRRDVLTVLFAVIATGCQETGTANLETEDQKASYAIGLGMGQRLQPVNSHIDLSALRAGIEDAMAERDARLSDEEMQTVMAAFNETVQAEAQAESAGEATSNAEAGEAYRAQNGQKDGVTTTASGLQYEVMREGTGPKPAPSDQVTINYRGTLIDGTEFDSSYERGAPATFGVGGVIAGFGEGLQLMEVGSQYRLVIPGDIGYGMGGSAPNIGPNATLIFEIELLEIPED